MRDFIERAKYIIKDRVPLPEVRDLKELVRVLKGELEFGLCRKILSKAHDEVKEDVWILQQLALCTYKDEELLPATRFSEALSLLEIIGLRDPSGAEKSKMIDPKTLPETLALGGAVYKRMWEYGGQLEHLYQALAFYQGAWERDWEQDKGYGGVNAAYILDVLAMRSNTIALRSGIKPEEADYAIELKQKAQSLREAMSREVPKLRDKDPSLNDQYWYLVTLAEIDFGLRKYDEAGKWLAKAGKTEADEWKWQTTFKQLVSLAQLQGCKPPAEGTDVKDWHPAWQALYKFIGKDTERALSCYRGKVGLALSGGGFRASFFHLGVLARLAEMDVLRYVEVLSTVSGGSIVGALYYLEIQDLLKNREDKDINREDYITLVERVRERFLAGVKRNLRTRTLSNLWINLKMIFSKEYSRSHRIGDLYENELYSLIGEENKIRRIAPRTMRQLLVVPADQMIDKSVKKKTPFNPKFSNWKRRAKVPVLLLNSTSLNSGHSWHFTARWMGEPPGSVSTEVDINERYRRLWYDQASKKKHQNYRLGYAVASSACVPGLFEPLNLEGLYPGRTVRLVDGGVHDNQGVEGLLDEGCTLVLCSDASGQMEDQKRPSDNFIGVPLRSNSILMDRVREAEYQDLRARTDSLSIQGLFFIHLKKGLQTLPIDWVGCDDPTIPPQKSICTTDYGVDKDIQRKLADIRTDLDSFSEVEAYSLMLSGYLMTEYEFKELDRQHKRDSGCPLTALESGGQDKKQELDAEFGTWGDFDIYAPRGDWRFLKLEHLIRQPPDSSDARRTELGKHLEVGANRLFKVWKLSPILRGVIWTAIPLAVFFIIRLMQIYWTHELALPTISVCELAIVLILFLAGIIVPVLKWLRPEKALRGYFWKGIVAIFGWVLAILHLQIFDRLFQKLGSLERLLRLR